MKPKKVLILLLLFMDCDHRGEAGNVKMPEIEQFADETELMPTVSFRIIFGMKDLEPKSWDGYIVPDTNQVLKIEIDRFRDHQYSARGYSSQGITTIKLGDPDLSNDYLKTDTSWICSTREAPMHGPTSEWHDHGQIDNLHNHQVLRRVIQQPSILVHLRSHSISQPVFINTVNGAFSFFPEDIISRKNAYFLGSSVKVELIPSVQRVSAERMGQQDFPSILSSTSGDLWISWQEYDDKNDKVLVRRRKENRWGAIDVLTQKADIFHSVLAEDSKNRIWAVWSRQVNGTWDLFGCFFDGAKWSNQQKLTNTKGANNIYHKMVTDSEGRMWLVWQRVVADGFSQIYAKNFNGKEWSEEEQISVGRSASGNNWWPSVAVGKDGYLAVVWDGYAAGSYDIYLRLRRGNTWKDVTVARGTPRFEAHPTVAIDGNNKVWIAWDESGANWGKDTGFLVDDRELKGIQLHESRSIGVVCYNNGQWLEPKEHLRNVLNPHEYWELPHLQIDAFGRPLLFVRHLVMREPDTPLEGPIDLALWEIYLLRYNGLSWSDPMYLPRSTGRNDMMPASALCNDENVYAVWATDLRDAKSFQEQHLQVQVGKIGKYFSNEDCEMQPYYSDPSKSFRPFDPEEAEQVKKIRAYRIKNSEKTYSIYRGDLHRHTDISVDGNNDGSLLDAYRYTRDVAELDFVGVADHTDNVADTYNWWRSQKVADLFQIQNSFVAFYGYERSVEYPNGHRNIFFINRDAADILPIGSLEARGYLGTGKLYWYLRRNNGFSVPHTTGRTSGTDWRDNDPKVENLLELFQGMRDSYEYPGSPRPYKFFSLPDSTKPVPRASSAPTSSSFRSLGFAWNALEKGYKLGFIASSDHISTHISYACLIAEELTLESLLEAVRNRRSYAATDNIILDIRHKGSKGEYLMGDIFDSETPVKILANVIGTGDILQIDIIKNSIILNTYRPNQSEFSFEYTDSEGTDKDGYFYVRVIQKDGEMAWGSPVWVTYIE